jgi:Carboxypeptidase regulatory-like domain
MQKRQVPRSNRRIPSIRGISTGNLNPVTTSAIFHSMRRFRILVVLILIFYRSGGAAAQIIEERRVGDKTITCMHTGLSNSDCGMRTDWYAYTFVGSISTISSIEDDEKKIQIVPEEIFHGNPPSPLTVFTSDAACLPRLAVGDRWLFFLRKEKGKPIVLDYYGNDSLPVADGKEQIETLRRLKNIGNFGIVRGYVLRNQQGQGISNATVVAHRMPDDLKVYAITDTNGRYEFQPLPTGKYKFTVDPIGSFRLDESQDDDGFEVTRGSCWQEVLAHSPHVELGGHVRRFDGSPMPSVDILIISEDNSWSTSKTNEQGYFNIEWLQPGAYVVGLNLPSAPAWKSRGCAGSACKAPPASLYYSGVQDRSSALAVKLVDGEKRGDIDFTVPNQ